MKLKTLSGIFISSLLLAITLPAVYCLTDESIVAEEETAVTEDIGESNIITESISTDESSSVEKKLSEEEVQEINDAFMDYLDAIANYDGVDESLDKYEYLMCDEVVTLRHMNAGILQFAWADLKTVNLPVRGGSVVAFQQFGKNAEARIKSEEERIRKLIADGKIEEDSFDSVDNSTTSNSGVVSESKDSSEEIYYSSDFEATVYSYYYTVPENIRTSFESNSWQLKIIDDLSGTYGYTTPRLAMTRFADKIIYIDNRDAAKASIQHEMGHYLDYMLGWISLKSDFEAIYNAEVESFKGIHSTHSNNTSDVREYFAEAFQFYINNALSLQASCPQTYDYIVNAISSLQ